MDTTFHIQPMEPEHYRSSTRKATLILMAIFIVIGFASSMTFTHYLGQYFDSQLAPQFIGAFLGLLFLSFMVSTWFKKQEWMREAMYGWQLKRALMRITNVMRPIQEAIDQGDTQAMKILRFYHLGLTQMHTLEGNSHGQIELNAEKKALETQLTEHNIDLEQISLNTEWLKPYTEKLNQGTHDDER